MDIQREQPWVPRVLVMGPGGVKGLKILGFLSPIEDSGLLESVDTYCGVSVGAVISLLIICGYQIREIVGEATKLDIFKEFGVFDAKLMIENIGLMSNEQIRKLLTQLVINKFGSIPTLHGLYMRTGKSLCLVTLDAMNEQCVLMNPFTYSDTSCIDATMFSMNIPFFFYQLIYKGKVYADGALANPYPIDYFDDGNTNILGIYLKTIYNKNISPSSYIPGVIVQKLEEPSLSFMTYALKMFSSLMDQRRNHIIQLASSKCIHVCLETKTSDSVGYTVTTDDKAAMLVEGFNEGKLFLTQLQANTYIGPKIPPKIRYSYPPYYMANDIISNNNNPDDSNVNILSSMNNPENQ